MVRNQRISDPTIGSWWKSAEQEEPEHREYPDALPTSGPYTRGKGGGTRESAPNTPSPIDPGGGRNGPVPSVARRGPSVRMGRVAGGADGDIADSGCGDRFRSDSRPVILSVTVLAQPGRSPGPRRVGPGGESGPSSGRLIRSPRRSGGSGRGSVIEDRTIRDERPKPAEPAVLPSPGASTSGSGTK